MSQDQSGKEVKVQIILKGLYLIWRNRKCKGSGVGLVEEVLHTQMEMCESENNERLD